MTIQEKYPGLSQYIEETPILIPDSNDPEINVNNLTNYLQSLESILKNYSVAHEYKIF